MKKQKRLVVVKAFSKEYRGSAKKQKSMLLERLIKTTGYSRKHLMEILSKSPKTKRIRRKRVSKYLFVIKHLRKLWAISNYACGQRLTPMIPSYLAALRRHRELFVTKEERELLCSISHATVDRLLQHERRKISLKGRSRTKPGTLLKHQTPIRTFADWNEKQPGFLEIDTVHHCGDSLRGDYVHTLDTTDIFTGWNECRAFMGKSERNTVEALEHIKQNKLPFPMLGIDFDTGGEFVNYHLIRYSDLNKISYTRAREGKKNDQNYIEQQNYSVVRRFAGYQRLDTQEQLQILNRVYDLLSDYQNFFQPVMRLKEKVRNGTRVTRRYDKPKTAYQRVLGDKRIIPEVKKKLRERYKKLNPKKLILEITNLGKKLSKR